MWPRGKYLACLIAPAIFALVPIASHDVAAKPQNREDEIVASLAGGRVIVHVAKDDTIVFGVIDHPVEAGSVPPRVMNLDGQHIAVLFGASEWKVPAEPLPTRLDQDFQRVGRGDPRFRQDASAGDPDLEMIGVGFLEKLRPLVAQLHLKLDLSADEPIFEFVLIGHAPDNYGPEVWTVEFRAKQEQVPAREEYWQTRILRPRFTQLYPPDKHEAHTIVEAHYPSSLDEPPLARLIEANDPLIASLRSGDARFAKLEDVVNRGEAQKVERKDVTEFMRAVIPLMAGKSHYFIGTLNERDGLEWIVQPSEPIQKAKQDKNRPPDAPTLRH
jgi:hypothetical protein